MHVECGTSGPALARRGRDLRIVLPWIFPLSIVGGGAYAIAADWIGWPTNVVVFGGYLVGMSVVIALARRAERRKAILKGAEREEAAP